MSWKHAVTMAMTTAAIAGMVCVNAVAGGLTTKLGEVWLDNVRAGTRFSLQESLNMPLRVTNTSSKPVELKMELWINKPGDRDLKEGYEPIPDPAWVKLERELIARVEPNADAVTDIVIDIPKDKKFLGKKYQFYVWTRTTGGLSNVNVGVMSRFLITVISADNLAVLEGRKKPDVIQANLDFSLMPYEIMVKGLAPGSEQDLERISGTPLKVVNPNTRAMKFRVSSSTSKDAKTFVKAGYEDIPDAGWVSFKDPEFNVPEESIKRLKAAINVPDRPEYRGKRYQAILVLEALGQDVAAKVYARLYVTVKE